jgi:uncharacterized protein
MRSLLLLPFLLLCTASALAQNEGIEAFQNQDYAKAMRLLRPTAEQGDVRSQFAVGMMLEGGLAGEPQNPAEAARWYRRASDQDFPPAPLYLAVLYQQGSGVEKNLDSAIALYRKAYRLGSDNHQIAMHSSFQLGEIYSEVGNGAEAARWYATAGQHGNDDGSFKAGWIYSQGVGVERNDSIAIIHFRSAATMKNTRAMGLLAALLAQGSKENVVEAYTWAALAAESDPVQAGTTTRFVLREYLSPEQIKEAEQLMIQWRARWRGNVEDNSAP